MLGSQRDDFHIARVRQSPAALIVLLSLTSLPVSWHTTMARSIQISTTWTVCSGPHLYLQGTHYPRYQVPSIAFNCLWSLLNHPWETFPSHLAGVASKTQSFFPLPNPPSMPTSQGCQGLGFHTMGHDIPALEQPGHQGLTKLVAEISHLSPGLSLALPPPAVVLPLHPSLCKLIWSWISPSGQDQLLQAAPVVQLSWSGHSACSSDFLLLLP